MLTTVFLLVCGGVIGLLIGYFMSRTKPGMRAWDCLWLLIAGCAIGLLIGLSMSPVVYIVVTTTIAITGTIVGALAGVNTLSDHPTTADNSTSTPSLPSQQTDGGTVTPLSQQTDGDVSLSSASRLTSPPLDRTIQPILSTISPAPLAIMLIGLILGAISGIYIRTGDYLGVDPNIVVAKWAAPTGLQKEAIATRVFNGLYPPITSPLSPSTPTETEGPSGNSDQGGHINPTESSSAYDLRGGLKNGSQFQDCDQLRTARTNKTMMRQIMKLSQNRSFNEVSRIDDQKVLSAVVDVACGGKESSK